MPRLAHTSLSWFAAFGLVIGACGSEDTASEPSPPSSMAPSTTEASPTTTEQVDEPVQLVGAVVATATGEGVSAYTEIDDETAAWFFPSPTQFGGDRVFLVLEERDEFLRVQLPIRPNGSTGWIRREQVEVGAVTTRAQVDLRDNSLTVWDGDEILVQTDAAVGKPSTPTPLGEFFVRDIIKKNPNGAYGSFILGLSGFSEVLDTFNGGEPAIAIHGTNRPELVGQEVSNGCVRIPNDLVELLAETVPLGTPVQIVG